MSEEQAEFLIWLGFGSSYDPDSWYEALAALLAERAPA
jgi:hypothetical protein